MYSKLVVGLKQQGINVDKWGKQQQTIIIQQKLLNVITLGQRETDNNN
jgi:hypothetical protein